MDEQVLEKAASDFLEQLHQGDMARLVKNEHYHLQKLARQIDSTWGRAIDILETILVLSRDIAVDLDNYREQAKAEEDLVFVCLRRLYTRACLTASEIITLLRSGHGRGAEGRWRTLYEYTVVSIFIEDEGQETARRFLDHEKIQLYQMAKTLEECGDKNILTEKDIEKIEKDEQRLKSLYGKQFHKDYGWTGTLTTPKLSFIDLERKVGLSDLRHFYKNASYSIHSGPMDNFFASLEDDNVLNTIPTKDNISTPSMLTCMSLYYMAAVIIEHKSNEKTAILLEVIYQLTEKANQIFSDIESQLEKQKETYENPEH